MRSIHLFFLILTLVVAAFVFDRGPARASLAPGQPTGLRVADLPLERSFSYVLPLSFNQTPLDGYLFTQGAVAIADITVPAGTALVFTKIEPVLPGTSLITPAGTALERASVHIDGVLRFVGPTLVMRGASNGGLAFYSIGESSIPVIARAGSVIRLQSESPNLMVQGYFAPESELINE